MNRDEFNIIMVLNGELRNKAHYIRLALQYDSSSVNSYNLTHLPKTKDKVIHVGIDEEFADRCFVLVEFNNGEFGGYRDEYIPIHLFLHSLEFIKLKYEDAVENWIVRCKDSEKTIKAINEKQTKSDELETLAKLKEKYPDA